MTRPTRIVAVASAGGHWVQLMRLRSEGLVAARREGRHVFYRLERPEVIAVITALQATFCAPGERLIPQAT